MSPYHWSRVGAALFASAAIALLSARADSASVERASIVPLVNAYIGNAVNNVQGFSMYANGITDYWSTASTATLSFAVFVFPGRQVTQDIGFAVLPPDGGKPVYSYTFKAQTIGALGTWYNITAEGDFSKAGTYTAIATADGAEIGRIPVVFTAPAP